MTYTSYNGGGSTGPFPNRGLPSRICPYCKTRFSATLSRCPSCGAPSP